MAKTEHASFSARMSRELIVARANVLRAMGNAFFRGLSHAGKLHPDSRFELHGVEVIRDVAYKGSGADAQRLDVYRPIKRSGPLPVVLYLHGGGFHLLSKDTHWLMGLLFARAGYVVCNVDYRLAPKHRFPAALEDSADALYWLSRNVAHFGGDAQQLIVAGESAGANLALSLVLSACYRRREPYAQRVWGTGIVPKAAILGCGIYQVSDPERFSRRRSFPAVIRAMVHDISSGYLGSLSSDFALADPLLIVEERKAPDRPLPPCFAFVGTKDPVLDDTRRLVRALSDLGVPHEARYYPGELHAFHALMFRKAARACWQATFDFTARHVGMAKTRAADLSSAPQL